MLAEPSCQRSQFLQWMRSSAAVALLDKPLQAELTAAENQLLTSFRSSLALLQRVRRTGEDQAPERQICGVSAAQVGAFNRLPETSTPLLF